MKTKIIFEYNTRILDILDIRRKHLLILKISRCLDDLKEIGIFFDNYNALSNSPHYQEITTDD